MLNWTGSGLVSAGVLLFALGACGGGEQASVPPVAPVVKPAPPKDMFAGVQPDKGSAGSDANQTQDSDATQQDNSKAGKDKADEDETETAEGESKKPKADKAGGAKKDAARHAKPAAKKK